MEVVNMTEEMVTRFNAGDAVPMYNDENVEFSITLDKNKTYAKRIGSKKVACYMLSPQDKAAINAGNVHLFYDGATKVYIQNTTGVNLQ